MIYWIKSRFSKVSSLEEILTVRSKYWDSFCVFVIIQFEKIFKIVWHKHNLIISSVGSGHTNQYSHEIPHEYLFGWEKFSEKIILTKRKHNFPYRMCSNFLWDSFTFGEATSSHFLRVTTSTQQLLFQRNYFFWRAPFQEQSLLRGSYFFQKSYFFRARLLLSSQFLKIGSSLGQSLCRNSYIFDEGTCSE